jgi:hypothetical protein
MDKNYSLLGPGISYEENEVLRKQHQLKVEMSSRTKRSSLLHNCVAVKDLGPDAENLLSVNNTNICVNSVKTLKLNAYVGVYYAQKVL